MGCRVDLVIELGLGKHRQLPYVFGEPWSRAGQEHPPGLKFVGLRVEPHDLVRLRWGVIGNDATLTVRLKFLNQLGTGAAILNQDLVGLNLRQVRRVALAALISPLIPL